ncbi:carbon-nitrogen hydrolase family protein [Legionella hackeliae]|uniref:CN hydrolase domain-containing protein n=1 Tax=Legionella hackeliae TaxID=449 RepID=A0A0A8UQY8_LEGHA|nr:hypothetical protein [Legionella hackeliae]KTD15343.1 hypothetical protein Lhac_0185 [Legionella hackeliae]CEK11290.1 protein of unknown function [Legionella hackeliae]STX48059.1 Uncharacterised protein [Legionella hackeliae]
MFRPTIHAEAGVEQQKNPTGNLANLKVFVFQPDKEFYSYPFEKKLQILEERIYLAKKSLGVNCVKTGKTEATTTDKSESFWAKKKAGFFKKKTPTKDMSGQWQESSAPTAIFIAPEYLFKDFSKICFDRYYSQEQKKEFKKKLAELSLDTNMLLVPGTICWFKKTEDENYYRNTAYFFYRGDIQKYKKKYPHTCYDFDYANEGFLNLMDLRRLYFKANISDPSVKDFGLKIGVEICYDSVQGSLASYIHENNSPIDMQLIIADGAKDPIVVQQDGMFFIKVERKASDTEIGTIKLHESDNKSVKLEPALSLGSIETSDLTCFQFK